MSETEGFLKRKNIVFSAQRYFIEALSYMALGLFSSLIIGTILNTIGGKLGITFFTDTIWPIAQAMTGPAIAVAVSYGLQSPPLVIFASVLTGAAGAELGGPVGAFLAAVFGAEFGKLVYKETKIDIIVTPATTIIVGVLVGKFVGPAVSTFMNEFGRMIIYATQLQPIPMGILISVLMGMALTLPISSAAIAIMLGLSGLAGGAATVGCSAQMIGFAVMSYRENGMSGLFAQGLGTSMLQMPNIIKNPRIWIPPTLTSAILGPLSTYIFKMENIPIGSGMGTSGFVGQFGTITAMEAIGRGGITLYLNILLLHFILPAVLTLLIAKFMRKRGWIKEGDLKLDL
ncbi:MAG TPA: PTS sugar transporter subunit IIC [Eubacteriaceae bacterium]|jgi:uncharacterized membrane protein|nr:PTS sugar transporter subunit IIC [Eubacteriaceae bacterium]